MFYARLKRVTQTLRFRLLLWIAGIVLFSVIASLVGLREAAYRTIQAEMDQVLKGDLNEVAAALETQSREVVQQEMERKAQSHAQHGWYVRIMDKQGEWIWANSSAPSTHFAVPSDKAFGPVSVENFRLVQRQVSVPRENATYTVRVGAKVDVLEENFRHIDNLVFIGGGIMLVAAPLLGYWVAGRLTRPLGVISDTMSRLRPSQLNERLPLRNTNDELDRLSKAFNALLDRTAAYLEQRRDFLANSAHELRTPLAAIRSAVEVAAAGQGGPEEYAELLDGVIDECTSLELLVNQLLLLAETEGDSLNIQGQRVDLTALVAQSVEIFRPVAENNDVRLDTGRLTPALVEGNRHSLRHVLNNLLDNALAFTRAQGGVTVSVAVDAENSTVTLSVADTGVGISEQDLPHIFERFFRCDRSRTRAPDARGTGLGLSICKAVVESHGGKIYAASKLGQGTTFYVVLPLAPQGDGPVLMESESVLTARSL